MTIPHANHHILMLLFTCATLTTGSGAHMAKLGVFLCIAVIFDFIQVTNKYVIALMNAILCQSRLCTTMKSFFVPLRDI